MNHKLQSHMEDLIPLKTLQVTQERKVSVLGDRSGRYHGLGGIHPEELVPNVVCGLVPGLAFVTPRG
jgi:hypothetical protein